MKKIISITLAMLYFISSAGYSLTLTSLNKDEFKKAFVNKTSVSIATDNLNGRTINNIFSMFLDYRGKIIGKMSVKPANEPQMDEGTYSIDDDGTAYITWKHWDGSKKLCFHSFKTENAYINVDCDNIFHTVFMKEAIRAGNRL